MTSDDADPDRSGDDQALTPGLREQLSALGIAEEYEDAFGDMRHIDPEVARELIRAMGVEPGRDVPSHDDAVLVTRPDRRDRVPPGTLVLEDGSRHRIEGRIEGRLPPELPLGYHRLERADGSVTSVIVSPGSCAPHPGGTWGWSVQVYALLSDESWGIGDLADLRRLAAWSAHVGAGVLLINPLDAMVARPVRSDSPYSPSSRRFLDPIYLRVEEVPGAGRIADVLPALAERARGGDEHIDRTVVAQAKLEALERIYAAAPDAGREEGFERFVAERGEVLQRFATFEALVETHGGGWRGWPTAFHDPDGEAVTSFAARHRDRVRFHAWLQWLVDEQLRAAAAMAPLMHDLPVGVDPDGFDAWTWQEMLAEGVTVGAPPDELGPEGQDWGLPAFVPFRLRAAAYRPFVEVLRAAFRHGAALRIDHVLGLFRLFWVPGGRPRLGSYVQQDTDALFDILALESHRAGAWVVGEDLGTVGEGVRDELVARGLLRYRVLLFESEPPRRWAPQAVGAVSTHDLPSIGGVWSGAEREVRRQLGQADAEVDVEVEALRTDLVARLGVDPEADTSEACVASARLLASAGCDVVLVQLEDAVAATHRINVPGTDQSQRPANWSIPLPVRLEDIGTDATVIRVVDVLRRQRPPEC